MPLTMIPPRDPAQKGARSQPHQNILKPRWRLDELILSNDIRLALSEIAAFYREKPKILETYEFRKFMKTGTGLTVNFSGPSGTGKSSTAEALAAELSLGLIKIDAGNVISSTLGGSAKALTSVMDDADKNDVLLFFDEADVLLSKRSTNISQAADQEISSLKGRLLTRLDAFNGLVVFATNFPAIYDPAFRRRIIFQVPFQIPQVKELEELILFHLANAPHTVDISAAAPPTLGLSGGDVKAICIRLASQLASKRISIITTDDYIAMVTLYKSAWDFGAKSKIDTTTQTV